jgi:hypothetical protein
MMVNNGSLRWVTLLLLLYSSPSQAIIVHCGTLGHYFQHVLEIVP